MVAITEDGLLYTWGDNRCAQLGLDIKEGGTGIGTGGSLPQFHSPVLGLPSPSLHSAGRIGGESHSNVEGSSTVYGLSSPSSSSIGMDSPIHQSSYNTNSSVYSLNTMMGGVVGDLNAVMACGPVLVENMRDIRVIAVACGAYHTVCLSDTGAVYSWGRGSNGRLGQFSVR